MADGKTIYLEMPVNTIAELVDERRKTDSDKIFCYYEDKTIRFGELANSVTLAAAALHREGVRSGDRVAMMIDNHPDHIVLYLALAWLGAVHIPISVHLKSNGLSLQLSDCEPMFLLAEAQYASELVPALSEIHGGPKVLWRTEPESERAENSLSSILAKTEKTDIDRVPTDLDRLAMISYTSGTTGPPKGVMLNERFLLVGAKNAARLAEVTSTDTLFLWEPFYHIAGWTTVLMGLQLGIPIALVAKFSASQCWNQIRKYRATKFHYLGGVINILLRQASHPDDANNTLTTAWGAAAPAATWREFENRFGVRIREGYGISEAANFATLNLDGPVGSIGKPVDEFEVSILGPDGKRLPPSQTGEIVLWPKYQGLVMLGYFRNPTKTAEVIKGGAIYTGDLGYQDEQGYYYFSGRMKDSLRRRGENVSAWEVERVINSHPMVLESAIIGVPSEIGDEDIKAFVKLSDGCDVPAKEIIAWCSPRLAYYQVPRYVEFVEEFPRGPTQRIQKSHLSPSVEGAYDFERAGCRT